MTNKKDEFITCQTQLGWLAGKIVDEDDEKYIIQFGGEKKWEVLKEEIFHDEEGTKHVLWW